VGRSVDVVRCADSGPSEGPTSVAQNNSVLPAASSEAPEPEEEEEEEDREGRGKRSIETRYKVRRVVWSRGSVRSPVLR